MNAPAPLLFLFLRGRTSAHCKVIRDTDRLNFPQPPGASLEPLPRIPMTTVGVIERLSFLVFPLVVTTARRKTRFVEEDPVAWKVAGTLDRMEQNRGAN